MTTVLRALRELTDHADLILSFARRDIKARYKQTAFGIAWAIVQPLSWMLIFTLVFDRFARVPSDGVPYPLFAFSVLIFWAFFTTSVAQGTVALTANAVLVRKIWFPRETLLLSVMLAAGLDLAIATGSYIGLSIYFGFPPTWSALWVLPLLLVQAVFTLGIICATSALHAYFRDVGHAIPLALQLWMFATPIAYPLTVVPEHLRPLYLLNPMAPLIDAYRRVLLHGEAPDPARLLGGMTLAILVTVMTYALFKRVERSVADVI